MQGKASIPQDIGAEETAEFNSALALLKRVNELEYEIEASLINWDLRGCLAYLESYENELCFSFKEEEQTEVDEAKAKVIAILNKHPNLGMVIRDGRNKEYMAGTKVMPLVRKELIVLNKMLRKLKHKYGMGMPKKGEGKMF